MITKNHVIGKESPKCLLLQLNVYINLSKGSKISDKLQDVQTLWFEFLGTIHVDIMKEILMYTCLKIYICKEIKQ